MDALPSEERVLLGSPREKDLASDPKATAEEALRSDPTTARPDVPADLWGRRREE